MSNLFNIDIVNPEQSFLSKDNVFEVVIPAVEGEIGILKDHIPIISFLKPGIIRVFSESEEQNFYVEDGIVEFKDNTLSLERKDCSGLTISILKRLLIKQLHLLPFFQLFLLLLLLCQPYKKQLQADGHILLCILRQSL